MVAFLNIVVVVVIIIIVIISVANSRLANVLTAILHKPNVLPCSGLTEPFGAAVN
jgi:type IV secretory pathway VirB6-like protein